MTPMLNLQAAPVLAMAAPADSGVSPWVQFLPFVLVIAIFYFVIMLPMKRRQKKVSKAAVGGYQGQEPVVSDNPQ
jgi:hypothetical protein